MAQTVGELAQGARLPHARENLGGSRKKSRPAELVEFVNEALATPPELAAQTLIALANSSLIVETDWKLELLEQAFFLAGKATYPIALKQVEDTDSRERSLDDVMRLGLTTLALRTAVLNAFLKVSPARARELLLEMLPLKIAPVTCEQDLRVAPLNEFYQVASSVISQSFTPEEQAKFLHIDLIERLLREATHPLQISGALQLLQRVSLVSAKTGLPAVQLERHQQFVAQRVRLLERLQEAMRASEVDARSFALTNAANDFVAEFGKVVGTSQQMGLPVSELLLSGRHWLARQFSQHHCLPDSDRRRIKGLASALQEYNNLMKLSERPLDPFTLAEFSDLALKTSPVFNEFWQTASAKNVLTSLRALRFGELEKRVEQTKEGKRPQPLTLAERDTQAWHSQLNEFLLQIDKWKPEEEATEVVYFHQRCITYIMLIELTPNGVMRDQALSGYLNFMRQQRWQRDSFVEWYWYIYILPRLLSDTERQWLYESYANAHDNVLQLIAKREKLLPSQQAQLKNN